MGNLLKLMHSSLAGPLLGVSLAMSGCLIPQNDNPLPVDPETLVVENHRPRILVNSIRADQLGATMFVPNPQTPCPRPDFSVVVEDEDTGDRISTKWRASTIDGATRTTWIDGPVDPNLGGDKAIRPKPYQPPLGLYDAQLLNMVGDRRIDVVITDGLFNILGFDAQHHEILDESPAHPHMKTDGTPANNEVAGVDTYTWTFSVQATCQ